MTDGHDPFDVLSSSLSLEEYLGMLYPRLIKCIPNTAGAVERQSTIRRSKAYVTLHDFKFLVFL